MVPVYCKPAFRAVVVLLILGCFASADAQDEGCYTSGSVAGIVIATIVVTIVLGGLAAAFIWYIWKQRKGSLEDAKPSEKPIVCPPMSPDKQLIAKENNDYAFDNPYFKDDEVDHKTPDAAEKGESGFHLDNGDITLASQLNAKAPNGTNGQAKKNCPFSSLPFHAVFHPSSGKKQKTTMDDTYISKHLERITVPLRGHDFTGLGFNICGNMRDGIFVKDVLHRGPASESGKIKAGDKIIGVTVSFGAMVYEDALTILSYASPYDVKLEIEKCPSSVSVGSPPHLPSSSPKKLGTSTSFRSGGTRSLFHPLYRSRSIDDLTQIGKDTFLSDNSPSSQKDPSTTPKRSQSVETNSAASKRAAFAAKSNDESGSKSLSSNKGSRKSSTSSCDSTGKVVTTIPLDNNLPAPAKEEIVKKEVKSSRFRVEQISVKSEAPVLQVKHVPPTKPTRDASEETATPDANESADVTKDKEVEPPLKPPTPVENTAPTNNGVTDKVTETEVDANKPTAPPRKISTPKRRAPAPPPVPSTKTETSAVVHRADEQPPLQLDAESEKRDDKEEIPSEPPPLPTSKLPDCVPVDKNTDLDLESSDSASVVSGSNASQKDSKDEMSSPGKRKASSLGDLTKLETNKSSASSAILERAVSLDLQQSMPGDNLVKQKKVLKAPTFEDDYDEDRENDFHEAEGLKRWDNGLDKVIGLTNGHVKHEGDLSEHEGVKVSEVKVDEGVSLTSVIESEAVTKKLITVDIDLDSSSSETALQETLDSEKHLTSTPIRKVIEVKNFLKDDDSLDDVPYLASSERQEGESEEELTTKLSTKTTTNSIFAPVTISIPVIKPDLTHFEKLPSPPPTSTHPSLDPNWRGVSKTVTTEDPTRFGLERISVQSLYRPIFNSKEVPVLEEVTTDASKEKLVNGNESDSSEHYSTAHETSVEANSVSTLSVTLSPVSTANGTSVTIKTPNNVAGFAKTLIIPGPNEVENLLSLAAEPNTPPPQLELPPKPVENE